MPLQQTSRSHVHPTDPYYVVTWLAYWLPFRDSPRTTEPDWSLYHGGKAKTTNRTEGSICPRPAPDTSLQLCKWFRRGFFRRWSPLRPSNSPVEGSLRTKEMGDGIPRSSRYLNTSGLLSRRIYTHRYSGRHRGAPGRAPSPLARIPSLGSHDLLATETPRHAGPYLSLTRSQISRVNVRRSDHFIRTMVTLARL